MTPQQSLVHTPLVLTALTVDGTTLQADNPAHKPRLPAKGSVEQEGPTESWISDRGDPPNEAGPVHQGIFSQALPNSIPRQFIIGVPGESNRYPIYVLTERPLCSCSLARMLRTVSSDARGSKAIPSILGNHKDFSIILAPGHDFSGPVQSPRCQQDDHIRRTRPQTYTIADILAHHLALLATGTRQLAPGRFLVLVHENWFVNGLLLVEFDVPCNPTSNSTNHLKNEDTDSNDSSTPESEDLPPNATLSKHTKRTKITRPDKSGQLGFVRVGADWAENAIRLLRDDSSHWAELKEVEMTAEWADPIDGYTGTEWQTMGLEGYNTIDAVTLA